MNVCDGEERSVCSSSCAEVSRHPCTYVDSEDGLRSRLPWEPPFLTKPSPQLSCMSLTPNDKFIWDWKMFACVHNGYGQLWTGGLLESGLVALSTDGEALTIFTTSVPRGNRTPESTVSKISL